MATSFDDLPVPVGVLAPPPPGAWRLERSEPPVDLVGYVAWLWAVSWDLTDLGPHRQATLPHPSAHLVIEDDRVTVHGPRRTRFERTLRGSGRVVAARFEPAGLRPFLAGPIGPLVDRQVPAAEVLGRDRVDRLSPAVATATIALHDDDLPAAMAALGAGLAGLRAEADVEVDRDAARRMTAVNQTVDLIASDRTITDLGGLAEATGSHPRRLQRDLAEHVGLGPKAIIRRYRLQEAAAAAVNEGAVDWAVLAARLGYYDQAHLIRDFTRTVGTAPATYARLHGPGATTLD